MVSVIYLLSRDVRSEEKVCCEDSICEIVKTSRVCGFGPAMAMCDVDVDVGDERWKQTLLHSRGVVCVEVDLVEVRI